LEIDIRTYRRWKSSSTADRRKGAEKHVPRRLTEEERKKIISVCCSDELKDLTPYEIYAILLDRKDYIASISTMYRVLREHDLVHFRGNTRNRTKTSKPPERVATGPNQVWSWDITYMKTDVAGLYYYMYTIIDIWSKKIVGWCIDSTESSTVAEDLFKRIKGRLNIQTVYLHSDNGNPMKSGTMLMTLYKLGIVPSFSRPRVSNDNAFIESFFKTLKYMRPYPKAFKSIDAARAWVADFLDWYNTIHLHSSIGYVTPEQKHSGLAGTIIAERNKVKYQAYRKNKCRWSSKPSLLPDPQVVILNPSLEIHNAKAS